MQFERDVWQFYTSFQSTAVVHTFLSETYTRLSISNADIKSYENCYAFIYYIEHGKKYYALAKTAPDELKPVLLFYGMVQLMKACILTVDPDYPATTAVLAHGVSTRKRKKRDYSFLQDEVKIQKNGLLRYFSNCLFNQDLTIERFNMESLFSKIPEQNTIFSSSGMQLPSLRMKKRQDDTFHIRPSILDDLHMTERRFQEFLISSGARHMISVQGLDNNYIVLKTEIPNPHRCEPFLYHTSGDYYIPTKRELFEPIPEIIVHYLLLYNLSMICRYETEWWNDLFHTFVSNDLPFIRQFLTVTETKVPYLLSLFLQNNQNRP